MATESHGAAWSSKLRGAAEDLADAVEDYVFTTEGNKDAMRDAWQRYVDAAAQIDDEYSR